MPLSETEEDELIASLDDYTKTSRERRQAMVAGLALVDFNAVPGDIVECGVWRGGNIILARKFSPLRFVWAYDTFGGMTPAGPEDVTRRGMSGAQRASIKPGKWQAVSLGEVIVNLLEFGVYDESKLNFVVGDVCQTLRAWVPQRIALLRLDTDWYASTKTELAVLYPLLSPGGVLIVDDYGHWQGCKKAVDEYFGMEPKLMMVDYSCGMMVKPA